MSGIALLLLAAAEAGGSSGLGVTATPPALNSGSTMNPFTTGQTTAIPAGGSGSYSYSWAVGTIPVFGNFTIDSPTSATTTVTIDSFAPGDIVFGSIVCTVTDTVTSATAEAEVTIRHRDQGTPP